MPQNTLKMDVILSTEERTESKISKQYFILKTTAGEPMARMPKVALGNISLERGVHRWPKVFENILPIQSL
jgi:hypothetical protein